MTNEVSFLNEVRARGILTRKSPLIAWINNLDRIRFTIKVTRPRAGSGVNFISCVASGDAAHVVDSIGVGHFVAIEGEVRSASWKTADGKKDSSTLVAAFKISDYGLPPTPEQPPTFDEGGDQ